MTRHSFIGGSGHQPIWHFDNIVKPDTFKFAFVRNPWDRFVSAFHQGAPEKENGIEFIEGTKQERLTRFVHAIADWDFNAFDPISMRHNWPLNGWRFISQWYFICGEDGQIGLDFLGGYERIQEDWAKVCERVGVYEELHGERASSRDYRDFYDSETREIIAKIYRKDIELLGYEYG